MQTVSPGRIVHVRLPIGGGPTRGETRPALVVTTEDDEAQTIYVHVALDHRKDATYAMFPYATALILPLTVPYSAEDKPGTWGWPPRV